MSSNNINSTPSQNIEEGSIDYKKYLLTILANWYWFVISLFISLGIVQLINRYTMPVYQVTSSLIINDDARGKGLSGYENMIPGMEIFRNQKTVLNEIAILKSTSLAERAINGLTFDVTYMGVGRSGFKEAVLYNSCPFIVIKDSVKQNLFNYPIYIDIINNKEYNLIVDGQFNINKRLNFGENYSSGPFNFSIILKDSQSLTQEFGYSKYYFRFNSNNGLINSYKSRLSISPNDAKRGSVLYLSMVGNSPQQITDYLNKLMSEYIYKGLEEKNQTAINTVNFIDGQLAILDTSLRNAEMDLQNFRLENRLIDISKEGGIVYTRLEDLQNKKALAELQTRYYYYLQEYIENRNNLNQVVAPSTIDISDELLSKLIEQLNLQLAEKTEFLFTVQPENPKVNLIDTKIEYTREALLDNIKNLIKNNSINLNEIERQLRNADKELDKLPATERMLISIQRQYKVNDQIYTYLLQKRAEAAIAKASNVSDNQILDYAKVENAYLISPKSKSNNMMGLLIGLVLPFSLLILIDLINNKITSRSDIERKTSIPIISTIGHNQNTGDVPVFELPKSALAESFRGLRTNLQYLMHEKDQKVITITSTVSGEGKTFCSSNLAAIFAMAGKKTLLVGLDLRKPKVHKIFNLDNSIGISTYLIGQNDLNDILKESKIDNLYVAPSGPVPPNPAELLGSSAMVEFIKEVRKKFEVIILDTPPFGMVTDSRIISRLSDVTLFILRQNYSTLNILELLEETYQKQEIGHMGIIMNDIKNKGYYGYGYRYYNYSSDYRYGYYNTYGNYNKE